jgi:dTDP-4-amino-4,6-dideoxygalactose transaminase
MTPPKNSIPFVDLQSQHSPIKAEIISRWEAILDTTSFISGNWVEKFENRFAQFHDTDYCVAVSNGTTALELALRALGVQHGDHIIIPTNTFIATAEAVSNVGATPILVDCNQFSNIDCVQLESVVTKNTVGIIGVHLYGNPCDFDEISAFAAKHKLWTLEDAAQGHLATYKNRKVGSLGDIASFSFYPGKNLGAPGEGGAITTNSLELATKVRRLRAHGESERYKSDVIGTNARMIEVVASTLDLKLDYIERWTHQRREHAGKYFQHLSGMSQIRLIEKQNDRESCYHLFVVHCDQRDKVRDHLLERGVNTGLHYPLPIHLQKAYEELGYQRGAFPIAEAKATQMISLPMYAELSSEQIEYVCASLASAF